MRYYKSSPPENISNRELYDYLSGISEIIFEMSMKINLLEKTVSAAQEQTEQL